MEFSKSCTSKNDEQIIREVSLCIAYHREAIKYYKLLLLFFLIQAIFYCTNKFVSFLRHAECVESIYGLALFLQLSACLILLSATGYVVIRE